VLGFLNQKYHHPIGPKIRLEKHQKKAQKKKEKGD